MSLEGERYPLSLALGGNPPILVSFRVKTVIIYDDYGGLDPHPKAVTRGGGSAWLTQAVTSSRMGGSSDIVTTFALSYGFPQA